MTDHPGLEPQDELFVHAGQSLPTAWRESVFFVAGPIDGKGDVLIVNLLNHPARGAAEALVMGRVDDGLIFSRDTERLDAPRTRITAADVEIDVEEPFRRVRVHVPPAPRRRVSMDLRFQARTQPYLMRPHPVRVGRRLVWHQCHMIQAGTFAGTYTVDGGEPQHVERWWGQRDHSWGVRRHLDAPMWLWVALQLPDGMLGAWIWEGATGERLYTDGCWAPVDGAPVPITALAHDLAWVDAAGEAVTSAHSGRAIDGLRGQLRATLEDGRTVEVTGAGRWAARYGRRGGGQVYAQVTTDDGRRGSGVLELTGQRYLR